MGLTIHQAHQPCNIASPQKVNQMAVAIRTYATVLQRSFNHQP